MCATAEAGGEDWDTFQKNFGKYLKVGVVEDNDNRKDIGEFICFQSTADPSKLTTIGGYVDRMVDGQQCVYFVSGEGRAQCEMSPALEKVKGKGYEVRLETLNPMRLETLNPMMPDQA